LSTGSFEATEVSQSSKSLQIKGLREDLLVNQERFAEALGVTPLAVSRWESGGVIPSAQNYIRLTKLALEHGRAALALQFLEEAGIPEPLLRKLLPEFEKSFRRHLSHIGAALKAEGGAEHVPVPLLSIERFAHGSHEVAFSQMLREMREREPADRNVSFDSSVIPKPAETICVCAPREWMRPLFRKGDFVAIEVASQPIPPDPSHPAIKKLVKSALSGAGGVGARIVVACYRRPPEATSSSAAAGSFQLRVLSPSTEPIEQAGPWKLRTVIGLGTEVGAIAGIRFGRFPNLPGNWGWFTAEEWASEIQEASARGDAWSIFGRVVAWVGTADTDREASADDAGGADSEKKE
jgi:DNA-binding transcriptional regulator YiaG